MAIGITGREREIREERAQLWASMQAKIEKAHTSALSVEERTEYNSEEARLGELDGELTTNLAMQKRESEMAAAEGNGGDPDTRGARSEQTDAEKRQWDAFNAWAVGGDMAVTPEQRNLLQKHARGVPLDESRTGPAGDSAPLQTSPGSQGGYLVPPGFWNNLQIAEKEYGGVYPLFRQVDTDSGQPMQWPTTNPTSIVAQLLTENSQVTPQDVTFGLGTMNAYTYVAGPFLASIQIVNDSAFSVDGFLRDRISEAIGRSQAAAAWSGSGSSQPLGITAAITATGAGSVGAGGWFATTAAKSVATFESTAPGGSAQTELTAGALSFDTVYSMQTYVDPAYRKSGNTQWVGSDTWLQNQRKVTDNYGRSMIQQSVNVGGTGLGDTLAGYPVTIDNNAPNIAASTLAGPLFGSLQHAMVARNVRQVGVMRLNERYADYLAVAWLGFQRYDIRSNDMRAITQVKFAST